MEDESLDAFFVHLSQQNFEACQVIVARATHGEVTPLLQHIINFEVFYISFNWLRYADVSRCAILEVLEQRMKATELKSQLFRQVMGIVDVRRHLVKFYQDLMHSGVLSSDLSSNLDFLTKILREVTVSELSTYREACLCEIQSAQSCFRAAAAVSRLDYIGAVFTLTEAREHLRHWELLFIHKKYTPSFKNSKVEYNEIYKWHVQHFHNLLAKASLYFSPELKGMLDADVAEYGQELRQRIELSCTRLGVEVFCLARQAEGRISLRYSFPLKKAEELEVQLSGLVAEARGATVIERLYLSKCWLFVQIDDDVFAGVRFEDHGSASGIHDFFLSMSLRLLSSIPSFT